MKKNIMSKINLLVVALFLPLFIYGQQNTTMCTDVAILHENEKITITGQPNQEYIFKVYLNENGWTLEDECTGGCGNTFEVTGLTNGKNYVVDIRNSGWAELCQGGTFVTVVENTNSGGGGTPSCANSEDYDGDGICDVDDNCWGIPNANQLDSDGDGIGDVCDGTPNGEAGTVCQIPVDSALPKCYDNGTPTNPNDDLYSVRIVTTQVHSGSKIDAYNILVNGTLVAQNISIGSYFESAPLFPINSISDDELRLEYLSLGSPCAGSASVTSMPDIPTCSNETCPTDNDSDGVCSDEDCDDNDPNNTNIKQPIGTACDDGDSNTENDVIQSDECTCAGTLIGGENNSTLWLERTNAPSGIYTTSKTMVEDTLIAEKIIVQTDVYADYVFEKDYPLLSLLKLEQYIQENNHLPNIPPAKEIVAKGIDVSEMSVKHMEKIEELTLYLLQINKRLEQVEKENEQLKKVLDKSK